MGGRTLPGFILFYYLSTTDYLVLLKVTVIKIVCPLTRTNHRSMGQNRKPRIDPHTYSQLSVGKKKNTKAIRGRKDGLVSKREKWCWVDWLSVCKNRTLAHKRSQKLTPSKIVGLTVKHKTKEHLEENVGESPVTLGEPGSPVSVSQHGWHAGPGSSAGYGAV